MEAPPVIFSYKSNSKLNLGLEVLNKRNDNFHNLESIFVEIDLSDELFFQKSDHFIFTSNNQLLLQSNNNTIIQAYQYMKPLAAMYQPYSIHLSKNIPMGAGLGGGSSNAAATLKALNDLWKINLSSDELCNIATKIGSDVPFFINGKNQFIKGRGDKLNPLSQLKLAKYYILVIYPNIHINTKWAYQALKKGLEVPKRHNKFLDSNYQVNWQLLKNDFENVVFSTYPEISKIKEKLISRKVLYAGLSGSGSTVYGIFNNKEDASSASSLFSSYKTYLTSSIA